MKGGARPGAGRPRGSRSPARVAIEAARGDVDSACAYLKALMLDTTVDVARRDRAAMALAGIEARYTRPPGKREQAEIDGVRSVKGTQWEGLLPDDYDDVPARQKSRNELEWDELLAGRCGDPEC